MCKNFWGRDPDAAHPPVCEDRAKVIDAEATAAASPSTAKFPRETPTAKLEPGLEAGGAPTPAEPKPLGSQYPPPQGNQDTTEARKLMEGVSSGDKKDVPVIVTEEQIKKAQE